MKPMDAESLLEDLADRVHGVRQWLMALKCLRALSAALGCLALTAAVCWVLSRSLGWQVTGHCLAGVVVFCCTAGAILWTAHIHAESVTYSDAGAHIEAYKTLHRQLVTAMEYYEDRAHFPYSRGLTHHMIRRVCQRSRLQDFDRCVPRQRTWAYGLIIGLELLIVGGFLVSESLFWHDRWSQQVQAADWIQHADPAAQAQKPLAPVTEDILTEPNTLVTFEAESGLEISDTVRFVMREKEPNGLPGKAVLARDVSGVPNGETGTQTFSTQQFCETPGEYEYRFESQATTTAWSDLTVSPRPRVQAVLSQVSPPSDGEKQTSWQPVDQGRVDAVQGSDVAIKIQTDQPMSRLEVRANGEVIDTLTPDGNEALYPCQSDKRQSLTFTPINALGQAVHTPVTVDIVVAEDRPPKFELVTPGGDVPLTEPVPVPVTFRIKDDVGLARAAFYYEVKDRPAQCLEIPVPDQGQAVEFSHTLVLDQWHLVEGDTVMFYCQATDVPLDPCQPAQAAASEIYLIEIQREIQVKEPQQSNSSMFAETLMDALEYTRAIIKKTWTLSHVSEQTVDSMETGQALVKDLAHTEGVIKKNRDDDDMGFSVQDKVVLNQVIDALSEAEAFLQESRTGDAVDAEKKGYRILRDFIKESDLTPQQSPGAPTPEVPEKVKLQNTPEMPPTMSEQEAKAQLQNIQKQLQALAQQQKQLKKALAKTFKAEDDSKVKAVEQEPMSTYGLEREEQPVQDPSTSFSRQSQTEQTESQMQETSEVSQQSQGQSQSQSPGQGQSDSQGEGQSASQQRSQSSGTSQSKAQGQGQGQGQSEPSAQTQSMTQSSEGQGQGQSSQPSQAQSSAQSGEGQGQGEQGQSDSQDQGQSSSGQSQGQSAQSSQSPSSAQSGQGQSQGQSKNATSQSSPAGQGGNSESSSDPQQMSQGQGQGQGEGQSQSDSQGQGQSPPSSQSQSASQSGQGQSEGQTDSQGEAQGQGQSQSPASKSSPGGEGGNSESLSDPKDSSQGQGRGQPRQASSQQSMSPSQGQASQAMRLAMLEARQKALQSMADQIQEALERVAKAASGTEAQSGEQAAQHMQEASEAMDQVESQLDWMQQASDQVDQGRKAMSMAEMARILDRLTQADAAMDNALLNTALDKQIKQAQTLADQLMEDMQSMGQISEQDSEPLDAEAMKRRLENAERLLNSMIQAQSKVVQRQPHTQASPMMHSLTDQQETPPAEAARQMVSRLWTAMTALQRTEGRALERPGSVSHFWESENAFFERASQFEERTDQ
ncbi:MAG: hypothetical protein K9N55_08590 [Phycisphaerae bacterium]|nr:hypothetical protein [Phycisphaerae bacterium]